METQKFRDKIGTARDRADALHEAAGGTATHKNGLLPELFEELQLSLEELRVAEEELRAQNEELGDTRRLVEEERQRYQDLFDFAPDGYLFTDAAGKILEANRAAALLLGMTPRHLAGKPLAVYVAQEARAAFRTGLTQLQRENSGIEWETTLRPRRGAGFPAALTVSAVRDRGGALVALRWLVRDVTERKALQQRLQDANRDLERRVGERTALLETTLLSSPTPFAFLDNDMRFVRVNEAMARLNGRSVEGHLGHRPPDILHGGYWHRLEPLCRRALAGEAALGAEVPGEDPARPGARLAYLVSYYPVRVDGEVLGVGVGVEDITERRRAEEARGREHAHARRIADTLQTALMPTISENAFPGLSVSTLYEAASDEALIGGDFYDAYAVGEGKVALIVGDVSGKGLAAAAHTAEVKYALRAFMHEAPRPARALARLNDFICEMQRQDDWGSASLVVLALALVDPATGEVVYSSAGAEPLLARPAPDDSGGVIREVGARCGLVLGAAPGRDYREEAFTLPPGGMLLMATDGITEARADGALLGLDGLKRLVAGCGECPSVGQVSQVVLDGARAYAGGPLSDDVCLLVAQRL